MRLKDLNIIKIQKGFTLIELLVVIAILGVLAIALITTIDPVDKINSANDTGVVSAIAQFGKANDSYAAVHNNTYVAGTDVNTALAALQAAGEAKNPSYTPPGGYTVNYAVGAGNTTYAFWVSALKSKRNVNGTPPNGGPIYVWANGQGCFKTAGTVITAATTCP